VKYAFFAWVVWITGVSTLLGLFFNLPLSIYQAYQELATANLWDGIAKLATFAACVGVVYTKFGLIGVAVASTTVQAAVAAFNTLWLFRKKPWIRPQLSCFDWALVRSTLSDGLLLFLISISVIALFQCDKLVIGTILGPSAVTQYDLVGRLFVSAYGVFMILLTPLWAAHGEALRRGDWAWIHRGLRLSLIVGCGLCALCGFMLLLFGNFIFRVWMHGAVPAVPANLILAVTAMFVLRAWVDSRSVILNSANVLLPQVCFFIAHVAMNLIVAILLSKRFGVVGVAWATPLTALLTSVWGYPWLLRRLFATAPKAARAEIPTPAPAA